MTGIQIKMAMVAVCFVTIFLLGYWLNHLGKPYSTLWLSIHKLLSLGILVFLVRFMIQNAGLSGISSEAMVLLIASGILWFLTILSGGMMSMEMEWPSWFSLVHHVLPYLTVGLTGFTFYWIQLLF
jgi:hypothetical protein